MQTCKRDGVTTADAVRFFREGGFDQELYLFSEPDTDLDGLDDSVRVHSNAERFGAYRNWVQACRFLVDFTSAPFLVVVQDDADYCAGARTALEQQLASLDGTGFAYCSLYVAAANRGIGVLRRGKGWVRVPKPASIWGAVSMCFSREFLVKLLEWSKLRGTRPDGRGVDYRIQDFVRRRYQHPAYYHVPSLTTHLAHRGRTWRRRPPPRKSSAGLGYKKDWQP